MKKGENYEKSKSDLIVITRSNLYPIKCFTKIYSG